MTEPNWRERWLRAAGGYDPIDRRQLRRPRMPDYLLMIARIEPARVRRVPAAAIVDDGEDEDGEFAFISCPCGARPVARSKLERCSDCERYYVLIARGFVFVTYGEMSAPPLPAPAPPPVMAPS